MSSPTKSERLLLDTLHRYTAHPPMHSSAEHVLNTPPTSRKNTSSSDSSPHPRSASPSTYLSHPRQSSPSPSHQRNRKRASLPAHLGDDQGVPLPITVHEMALRARLERTLGDTARRERRSSNEVRDEDGAWPWRERERERLSTPSSSRSPSPSSISQHHQASTRSPIHPHHRRNTPNHKSPPQCTSLGTPTPTRLPPSKYTPNSRSEVRKPLLTPPPTPPGLASRMTGIGIGRPTTTSRSSRSGSRSGGSQASISDGGLSTSSQSDDSPIIQCKYTFSPSHPHRHPHSNSNPPSPSHPTTRPFNVRTASEQLRHTQGYVSFSSIEGCEPPETPVESDDLGRVRGRGRGASWIAMGLGVKGLGWVFGKDGTVEEGVIS